jgi:hypothetical protein
MSQASQEPNHNLGLTKGPDEIRAEAEEPAQPQQQIILPPIHETTIPKNSPLYDTIIHIVWLTQRPSSSLLLEKDFRALRTWFSSPTSGRYDPEYIRTSLRLQAPDCRLHVFWFEDIAEAPWYARYTDAIAGAIERMRSQGREVCFFVAARMEFVMILPLEQRALERARQYHNFGRMAER